MKRIIFKLLRSTGILRKPIPKPILESTIFQKGIPHHIKRMPTGQNELNLAFERTPDGLGWMTQVKAGRTLLGRLPEADTSLIRKHWVSGHDLRISVVDVMEKGLPWERIKIKIERA